MRHPDLIPGNSLLQPFVLVRSRGSWSRCCAGGENDRRLALRFSVVASSSSSSEPSMNFWRTVRSTGRSWSPSPKAGRSDSGRSRARPRFGGALPKNNKGHGGGACSGANADRGGPATASQRSSSAGRPRCCCSCSRQWILNQLDRRP